MLMVGGNSSTGKAVDAVKEFHQGHEGRPFRLATRIERIPGG